MSIVLWTRLEAVERTLAQLTPCVADLEALVQRVTTLEGQLAALSGNVPITACESRVEEVNRETRSGINDPNSRIENLGLPLSNAEAVTNLTRNAVQDQAVEGSQIGAAPNAFQTWNAQRASQAGRLREAIATIMRDAPGICAADVRARLDATPLGLQSIPRKRAIQLHMQAIRRAMPENALAPDARK